MTLSNQGKFQNVKASIEKYIQDNLVTIEGLTVDFEGFPFEGTDTEEWIEERILGKGTGDFHRQVSSSLMGQTVPVLLNMNVFVNPAKTQKTNRHYEIRDILADYFKIGTQIDLYDFANDNWTSSLQKMEIREIITDRSIPDPNFYMYNFTVSIDWMEKW